MQFLSTGTAMMRLGVLFVALGICGCAELVRRTGASVDEYALYRRCRLESSVEGRLAASYAYMSEHPSGQWRREVGGWLAEAEDAYLAAAWEDVERLRAFLKAIPEGRAARRAAQRIAELERWHEHQRDRERRFDDRVARIESRLAAAEKGRRELVVGFADWMRRFAKFEGWGRSMHELDGDFSRAFAETRPPPRCEKNGCTKTVIVEYGIPEVKRTSARQVVYDLRVSLRNDGVVQLELTGPGLFSRIGEALFLKPVVTGHHPMRTEAIIRSIGVVANAIDATLPAHACAVALISPTVLHRRCEGVDFRMIAATDVSEEDRVVVTPFGDSPESPNHSPR